MLYYHCVRDIIIMITTLQHARNEHRSARCFQTCFGSAASAFENIELADIHCALKMNFSVTLKGLIGYSINEYPYMCFTDLSRTTCARPNWKVHQENRNHDWSKKWLQQNSCSAVKVIAKEGFFSASRSKELNCTIHWFSSSSSERATPNSRTLRAKCLTGLLPQQTKKFHN